MALEIFIWRLWASFGSVVYRVRRGAFDCCRPRPLVVFHFVDKSEWTPLTFFLQTPFSFGRCRLVSSIPTLLPLL